MINSKILYRGDFSQNNTRIEFVDKQQSFRPELEAKLSELWNIFVEEAKEKGLTPWDGTYYMLVNIEDIKNREISTIKLSTVKYSRIKALGTFAKDYELSPSEYTNHLSTVAAIQTSDNLFVMGKRGATMHLTNIDFIGGGLQEDELKVTSLEDIKQNQIKEMLEEANISGDMLEKMEQIGILYSSSSNVLFTYFVKLNITSEQLIEIFKDRPEKEMAELIFIKPEDYPAYLRSLTSYRPLVADLLE